MAILIEDGSIVSGANSFVTVQEAIDYCSARALTFPTLEADIEPLLIKAIDFLFTLESRFNGIRVDGEQDLPFPRSEIYLFGIDISDTIPKQLKKAQCQLAYDLTQFELLETLGAKEIIEEGVGALKVRYSEKGSASTQSIPVAAMKLLQPLFSVNSGSPFFSVSR